MSHNHRHPVSEANSQSPFGNLTPSEFYARHKVTHSSHYLTNSRGLKLFTQSWIPLPPAKPIGLVAVIHGFTSESSWLVELTSVLIAQSGFVTCAIDHQGHGFSDSLHGLSCHIPDINPVVEDCLSFFDSFRAQHKPNLPSFIYSESLGSAITLLIVLNRGSSKPWDGVVLNGAMLGISSKFKPPWPMEHLLPFGATFFPTMQLVPTRCLQSVSFREEWKQKLAMASPNWYNAFPRCATALELLRICDEVQKRFEEVNVPFLVMHGSEDNVCDPASVKDLHKRASSVDKTLKIYPGMWHQLVGEPKENVDLVFGDMIEWLRTRALRANAASQHVAVRK